MKKNAKPQSFRRQLAGSMAELRAIMESGASPSSEGRLTVRTLEVTEPSTYDAKAIRKIRQELNVSQAIFARMVGVSGVLVRSWERGVRQPAPIARRLLDQIRDFPERFAGLVHPFVVTSPRRPILRTKKAS